MTRADKGTFRFAFFVFPRNGGRRPGAGHPRGKKHQVTIDKERQRARLCFRVAQRFDPLIEAQLDNAIGIRHLMMRDPETGKFERVTGDAAQIDAALKTKKAFWIYTKDPSVQAFSELMAHAIGRPAQQVEISGDEAKPITIRWKIERPDLATALPDGAKLLDGMKRVNGHAEDEEEP